MDFSKGAKVYTGDQKELGTLDRVVIDPRTREITDIVVRKGLILPDDKVIPITMVDTANKDSIQLKTFQADWEKLPTYDEHQYIIDDEHKLQRDDAVVVNTEPAYFYPPIVPTGGVFWPGGVTTGYVAQPPSAGQVLDQEIEPNIPEGTVALKEGAKVISADDQHIGSVEKIIVQSSGDNHATHFVISAGGLFKDKKLIPVMWIDKVEEETIHLAVKASVLNRLPAYTD